MTIDVPVLIIGGGGAGLTASMLLSNHGVKHLLVSSLPHTSVLPKAHVLNQRAMEIFDEIGVGQRISAVGTPAANMKSTAWYAGVAGSHDGYGRRLGKIESWGAGYTDPDYVAASPNRTENLPQIRLEPLLKERAEKMGGDIRFGHELTDFTQDDSGVTATILERETGKSYEVRARYMLGCDGGRTVGKKVGIELEGQRDLMRMVSIHMSADMSQYLKDPDVLIRWLFNPDFGGSLASGVLVAMGPDNWDQKSEEWVFHLQFPMEDDNAHIDEKVIERMNLTLGIPGFEPEIHHISRWTMEGVLANKFRNGRVFVAGDAAHRHPPTGGLGLVSAIHDVYNLTWKLVAVLNGAAGDALLDTYNDERRPVDGANVENSVAAALNHFNIDAAMGMSPERSAEDNWAELRPLWEDTPNSAEKRQAFNQAIVSQSMEFRHHNIEFGFTYNSAAVVDDGSPAHEPLDSIRIYEPMTKPGHPLPHAWVERQGVRTALVNQVHGGHFVLIAGEDGQDWIDAANALEDELGVPLKALRVGILEGDYLDARCSWTKYRQIAPTGAILVRPDRYVGFRSLEGVIDAKGALSAVFSQILAK